MGETSEEGACSSSRGFEKKGGEEGKNEKFTGFVPTSVSRWCWGIGLRFTGKVGNPRYSFLLRGYWVSWDR